MLTKALALELAPHNICVNSLNPVAIDTPMMRGIRSEDKSWEEHKEEVESTIPLGRLVKPEEVAYAALYLAFDESSALTGTCINVDCGRSI